MPLTPQDVADKLFSSAGRFSKHPGYDEAEVDAFLEEVENELRRLLDEQADLRAHVASLQAELIAAREAADTAAVVGQGGDQALAALQQARNEAQQARTRLAAYEGQVAALQQQLAEVQAAQQAAVALPDDSPEVLGLQEQVVALQAQLAAVQSAEPAARGEGPEVEEALRRAAVAEEELEQLRSALAESAARAEQAEATIEALQQRLAESDVAVSPASETEEALRRTLLIASRTADAAIAEARVEAEELREQARRDAAAQAAEAEQLAARVHAEVTAQVAELERSARARSEEAAREVAEMRSQAVGHIEVRVAELQQQIGSLQSFEQEYRTRLRAYLEMRLEELDAPVGPPVAAQGSAPART